MEWKTVHPYNPEYDYYTWEALDGFDYSHEIYVLSDGYDFVMIYHNEYESSNSLCYWTTHETHTGDFIDSSTKEDLPSLKKTCLQAFMRMQAEKKEK